MKIERKKGEKYFFHLQLKWETVILYSCKGLYDKRNFWTNYEQRVPLSYFFAGLQQSDLTSVRSGRYRCIAEGSSS